MSSPDVDDAAPQVRLHGVRGALSGPVTFTAEQEAVLGREPGHGPVLVVGGPGTGRSTLAVELVARRLEAGLDPHRVLVLAPTRRAAATLREQLGARLSAAGRDTRAATPVRTWSSYAFDLLRRARLHGPLSHLEHAPRLLSGAEQDTVIAELIEGLTASVGAVTMWPEDLRPALPTRGFRQEVRELVDRMSELGLEPGWLQAAGRQHGRPEWEAAAVLIQDYRDRLDLGMAEAFDPAGLIAAAVELLRVGAPPASDDARAGSATPGGDAPSAPPTMSVGEEFAAAERAHWQLIVVDDLQEASPAMHDLLRVLVTDVDCVLTASPDTTVQGFRGARPDLVHTYPDVLGGAAGARDSQQRVHVLTQGHRLGPKVLADWQRIAARIGTPSAAIVRARTELTPAAPRGGTEAVEPSAPDDAPRAEPSPATAVPTTAVLASREAELQFVLQEVLRIHHEDQVPLAEIAVLARSGTHVQELARFLEGESVPVHRDATGTVLKDQPAVAPLLSLLRTVTGIAAALERAQDAREDATAEDDPAEDDPTEGGPDTASPDTAGPDPALTPSDIVQQTLSALDVEELLRGRYGAATSLNVRRLRQDLLAQERAGGGTRASDELLVSAVLDPELTGVEAERHHGLQRLHRMFTAGLAAARDPGADAESVLWALWSAAERAHAWRTTALGATQRPDAARQARRADADLDAVVALFAAAERFVDHFPGASASAFSAYMESQDLPMDALTRSGATRDAVHVLTPAAAAGRGFHAVLVTGVQHGVWPNTQLRGQLLGATDLSDLVLRAHDAPWPTPRRTRLQDVRMDELRSFSTALSRARQRLRVSAVDGGDDRPSEFFELLQPPRDGQGQFLPTPVLPPLTTAALVAGLRGRLETAPEGSDPHDAAALAWLAVAGVRGAAPTDWWGMTPLSTQRPLRDPEDGPLRLSPSRVEALLRNPLDWVMAEVGANAATTLAQSIGVFVHRIAESFPDGPAEAVREELARALPSLGLPSTWVGDAQRERITQQIEAYIHYLSDARREGRHSVAQELRIDTELELDGVRVAISGSIDRLEVLDGKPFIVDLKTGASPPTNEAAAASPQLATYQVAVAAGALTAYPEITAQLIDPITPAGAALVQLGAGTKNTKVQTATVISTGEHERANIRRAALRSQGPRYLTLHETEQPCRHATLCPLCTPGRQVTEWSR